MVRLSCPGTLCGIVCVYECLRRAQAIEDRFRDTDQRRASQWTLHRVRQPTEPNRGIDRLMMPAKERGVLLDRQEFFPITNAHAPVLRPFRTCINGHRPSIHARYLGNSTRTMII